MLNRLLETVRKYPLLRLLLFFHGMAIALLSAYYYSQGNKLWRSALVVLIGLDENGNRIALYPVRGASLLLPWHLLPHDVAWLALDALVFGTLTIWLAYRIVGDEVRWQVAGRERAAADKLREATKLDAAAERRMQEAKAWEQRVQAIEARVAAREFEVVNREAEAQAHVEGKDVEVEKMSGALTRLKGEARDLREEVRELRGALSKRQEKE